MKNKQFCIFFILWMFGKFSSSFCQGYSDLPIKEQADRLKISILFGTTIYLYPTYKHIYPYFPGSKDETILYKNALNGLGGPVILTELNIYKNPKHQHGLGVSYGVFRTADGPSFDNYLTIREFLFYYPYYYCPFRSSNLFLVKNIYCGVKARYAFKKLHYEGDSNSGPPSTSGATSYFENSHTIISQLSVGYLSHGSVKIDFGINMNIAGLIFANYYFYKGLKYEYSKFFYFENIFYNWEIKIGFNL